jgi:hypothetical protein
MCRALEPQHLDGEPIGNLIGNPIAVKALS